MCEKPRRLLDRCWVGVFREHHFDDLSIDELLPHFDHRLGRASEDPHIVIGVLLLQQLHDQSDAATVEARVYAGDEFEAFLAEPEYVVLILPGTRESRHLINAETLAAMRAGAWLINVGRGAVVDEAALASALADGRLGGAVLDVFENEPLAPESPLWSLDNCVVTPHVAAESFPSDIAAIFAENWRRYRAGEPLRHVVDFERGY